MNIRERNWRIGMTDKQDINITVKIQGLGFIFWIMIVMLAFALGFATSSVLDLIDMVWRYAPC